MIYIMFYLLSNKIKGVNIVNGCNVQQHIFPGLLHKTQTVSASYITQPHHLTQIKSHFLLFTIRKERAGESIFTVMVLETRRSVVGLL